MRLIETINLSQDEISSHKFHTSHFSPSPHYKAGERENKPKRQVDAGWGGYIIVVQRDPRLLYQSDGWEWEMSELKIWVV